MTVSLSWSERCQLLAKPITEACAMTPVSAGPAALVRRIAKDLPECSFREVLCRGGWYRLGGVIGESGVRLSDHLEQWATARLAAHHGDLAALLDQQVGAPFRATTLSGRTHYLVAPTGSGSTDFLQLEIEDLQEAYAQPLFAHIEPPATVDEWVDARCGGCDRHAGPACGVPIGGAYYRFRRLTNIGERLDTMRENALAPAPVHRFVEDWDASSASQSSAFCNHWVLVLNEHLDRHRQTITRATPMPAVNGDLPRFGAPEGARGLELHNALLAFDRAVGYPLAWYFTLLTCPGKKTVPHWVPAAVASDTTDGFSYLPERDMAVIRRWLHQPYGF
jgi:hypothetical protein